MKLSNSIERIPTGVRNLDALLGGGLPRGTVTVFAGTPGAGKTTIAQQICFNNSSKEQKALIFQTLSEPAAKTMKYMSNFGFYDSKKLHDSIEFVDLGGLVRSKGLENATNVMLDHIKRAKPAFVVIDSFKVFEDLADSKEDLRKFTYEIAVQLMAWEITAFLTGEYSMKSIVTSPLFSVVDGIITMISKGSSFQARQLFCVLKMRGTYHDRETHPYIIGANGIEVFSSRTSIPERASGESSKTKIRRIDSGIPGLDPLVGGGIPCPSTTILSGVSGSGKTLFILQSICRGAQDHKEKGMIFSFELTEAELCTQAAAIGLNFEPLVKNGLVKIVFIPQSQILIEKNLEMMQEHIIEFGAKRIGIDSLSVFLERLSEPFLIREKVLQISTIIKSAGGVGLLTVNVPFWQSAHAEPHMKESVADAILLFSSELEGKTRKRYVEIFKMRGTNHANGKHEFSIGDKGFKISSASSKLAKKP